MTDQRSILAMMDPVNGAEASVTATGADGTTTRVSDATAGASGAGTTAVTTGRHSYDLPAPTDTGRV